MSLFQMILVVCPLVFFASFVDAIAGGGGLISLSAYTFTGIPTHMAYGSNKFSASVGTLFSTFRFLKSGTIHLKTALLSAFFALIGSALGAKLALLLSDQALKTTMMILLPCIAVFILFNKKTFGEDNHSSSLSSKMAIFLSAIIGFLIGTYDGFFGPGTGTFLILAYTTLMKFDFKTACGNTKIVNLSSNVAALVVYLFAGKVYFALAIPAAVCSVAGGWIGSGLAIKKGAKFIKPMLVFVLVLLFINMF